ncbi:FAD-binding oxidoreductase [Phenylobacterium sp. LH3H17]|uniref:NAD(P)/FAD-dependent oxidoreductase n=1 Tax=Phenylobacterium sp. LH3H17 TaxID=2903901 RepID=UPI0020C9B49C|nr:FAD-binding oxidoreductase [Phenylobacterium sp. LH3H17]UTP38875.1 FAD-binding oxidoreductase [Phenylobacterium sp. LH3H17]
MDEVARHVDILILGGGIAGAAIAAQLAGSRKVALLEREPVLAYHTTGRSAAMYIPSYGGSAVRPLTAASGAFLHAPPPAFGGSLLRRRAVLHIARQDQLQRLAAFVRAMDAGVDLRGLDGDTARALAPILRPQAVAAAVLEEEAGDIDVARLHAGYLRQARSAGALVLTGLGDIRLERRFGVWRAKTCGPQFSAPVVVNATGAWADQTALQAGARPQGLTPLLRTVVVTDAPTAPSFADWPVVKDVDEQFYFKPFSGQLLITPADEEPSAPCDAAPDPLDIACAMFRFADAADHPVVSVRRRWAGLRTFAPDRAPVVGWSRHDEGFFWMAGLGGFGIQTSPALGRLAASILLGRPVPPDLSDFGVDARAFVPDRPGPQPTVSPHLIQETAGRPPRRVPQACGPLPA